MPTQFQTTLPDEDQPTLGNGVEDEIAVDRESATTNYGSVRVHYRETGASAWIDWGVVPYDRLDPVIANLEDGEEYEVRLRTETEHATGAWTSPTSIVTKFPGVTGLAVASTTTTSVTMEWTDNADNEDGFDLERRERFGSSWGPWEDFDTLDPHAGTGTVTYTDSTALPDRTYQYRVTPFTEHSSATTDPVETTTQDDGVRSDRVRASGWDTVIEDPAGNTYDPTIHGEPSYRPTLNGLPTAELPTTNADRWTQPAFEEAPLRLYKDGDQLPIDTLTAVDHSASEATLQARGGSPLRQRVERSYQSQAVHTACQELIEAAGLEADVDVPATETLLDELLQAADTSSEFTTRLLTSVTASTPISIQSGSIDLLDSGAVIEGENGSLSGGAATRGGPAWSGNGVTDGDGEAVALSGSGEAAEWTFTAEYDWPDGALELQIREDYIGLDTPEVQWSLDDTPLYTEARAVGLGWFDILAAASDGAWSGGLSAGEHTLRAEVTSAGSDDYLIDVVAPLDGRFEYTFDNQTSDGSDGGRYLDGPEAVPDQFDLVFEDAATAYSVTAAHVDATLSGTGGAQHLAVSNDLGTTWDVANNTSTLDTQFAERGGTVRLRVRLSREGTRTDQTPLSGFEAQSLDSYGLSADLDDVATLVNRDYDGRISDLLTEIAEYGDLTWELVQTETGPKVIITRPGIRTDSAAASITSYSVTKDAGEIVTKAIVYGKAQPVRGEPVVADHGVAVDLANDYLVATSEVVRDASTGQSYARGVDYRIDSQAGTITTLAAGAIADGASLEVDYEHRSRGVFAADDHDGDSAHELSQTIPAATTDRACQQAALKIVQEASVPRWTAEATIDSSLVGIPLSAAIDLEDLPTRDQSLEVWGVDDQPGSVVLQLGNRDRVSEVVDDIKSRLEAVARLS